MGGDERFSRIGGKGPLLPRQIEVQCRPSGGNVRVRRDFVVCVQHLGTAVDVVVEQVEGVVGALQIGVRQKRRRDHVLQVEHQENKTLYFPLVGIEAAAFLACSSPPSAMWISLCATHPWSRKSWLSGSTSASHSQYSPALSTKCV